MKARNNKKTQPWLASKPGLRIVVKFRRGVPAGLTTAEMDVLFSRNDIIPWTHFKETIPAITVSSVFTSLTSAEMTQFTDRAAAVDKTYSPPDFYAYCAMDYTDHGETDALLQALLLHENVELAYPIYDATPPHGQKAEQLSSAFQDYLGPAPAGINAVYAWRTSGGDGDGCVKLIDVEQGWFFDHESFRVNRLPCTGLNHAFQDHGAAVLGVIMMKNSGTRPRGITPKVKSYVVSQWRPDGSLNNADAIMAALPHLRFGDILMLQAQVRDSTIRKNLWPVEVHEATFQAIRLANALGIIVIEAGGNGDLSLKWGNDLDRFESQGRKILNRTDPGFRDSGAIMVAAASAHLPHERIHDSNYGSRVDCYAWGEQVTTAGSFPKSSGYETNKYTNMFCGTSSAAAIVAGAAISIQSIAEANYSFRLNPAEMRRILSSAQYGTPSANRHSIDKIGVMPDLKKVIDEALPAIADNRSGRKEDVARGQD